MYDAYGGRVSYEIGTGWQPVTGTEPTSGQSDNNRLANTKEFDAQLGLYDHGMRYYDPEIGRYISRDPIGYGDGMNVYLYVSNNPINQYDPLGLGPLSKAAKAARELAERLLKVRKVAGRLPLNWRFAGKAFEFGAENAALARRFSKKEIAALASKYGKAGVRFSEEGFPQFGRWARESLTFAKGELTGTASDIAKANARLGLKETPAHMVWHHVEDATTLQLIPRELQEAVPHTGGAAIIRAEAAAAKGGILASMGELALCFAAPNSMDVRSQLEGGQAVPVGQVLAAAGEDVIEMFDVIEAHEAVKLSAKGYVETAQFIGDLYGTDVTQAVKDIKKPHSAASLRRELLSEDNPEGQ